MIKIICDACGKELTASEDVHSVEITYVAEGQAKYFMRKLEVCPTCAYNLKGNILTACKTEAK